ncbi:ADP-ribosylglycohydrolase family protein [Dietzia sp. WMMA184]|nr:ADP-ribosylglycohydrolase family protein [Dietzia sp. WMMA184]
MTGSGDRGWDDRVAGVMLGTAVGDALGAGYEFGSAPLGPEGP